MPPSARRGARGCFAFSGLASYIRVLSKSGGKPAMLRETTILLVKLRFIGGSVPPGPETRTSVGGGRGVRVRKSGGLGDSSGGPLAVAAAALSLRLLPVRAFPFKLVGRLRLADHQLPKLTCSPCVQGRGHRETFLEPLFGRRHSQAPSVLGHLKRKPALSLLT
jgi:hypothetical protein